MVNVEIIATSDKQGTDEYNAAQALKEIFERDFSSNINGRIIIMPSIVCYGQEHKDLDVVVIGTLDNFTDTLNTRAKTKNDKKKWVVDTEVSQRKIEFQNFCLCIEVKNHPVSRIKFQQPQTLVQYKGKWHDATHQSENQKYALKNFLDGQLSKSPYITNLIWLRNVSREDIPLYNNNLLPNDLRLSDLLIKICQNSLPLCYSNKCYSSCFSKNAAKDFSSKSTENITQIFELFTEAKKCIGHLTRTKLEKITKQQILKNQKYAQSIGKRLVIIRGKAGTGKTIKLLHIAYDLYHRRNYRCLILTYNKALVSDIRRMIALANVKTGIAAGTVSVQTIHSFIGNLIEAFDVGSLKNLGQKYSQEYMRLTSELALYLKEKVITVSDIQDLMKENHQAIAWDLILIDEGQDTPQDEKDILFRILGSNKVIVADGINQLIRQNYRVDWTQDIEYHKPIISEKRSLRQERNLCQFTKKYADILGIEWDVRSSDELVGGQVKIMPMSKYDIAVYNNIFNQCKSSGNQAYEMLFLCPPDLVKKTGQIDQYGRELREFSLKKEWREQGIHIWDGTSTAIRDDYPKRVEEHRVVQYDSCRGLEGWVTICLCIDDFFDYKVNSFHEDETKYPDQQLTLGLYSKEERARHIAFQWTMIAITRAIDTLVITLRNPNSEFASILRKVSDQCPDFVNWIE